jgi:hypothetical protein
MGPGGERFAGFASHPHPRLPGTVVGGKNDEMLETGLRQGAVQLQPRGVVGQLTIGTRTPPRGKAALFGNGPERIVGPANAERQFLVGGFPAKLLDKQFCEIAALEERAGALEVERHGGNYELCLPRFI